jgi:hypothetical protein
MGKSRSRAWMDDWRSTPAQFNLFITCQRSVVSIMQVRGKCYCREWELGLQIFLVSVSHFAVG